MGGEGWRIGGNDPVRWPPSAQGSWNRRCLMNKSTPRLGGLQPHTLTLSSGAYLVRARPDTRGLNYVFTVDSAITLRLDTCMS
jgi:hypothetical protein